MIIHRTLPSCCPAFYSVSYSPKQCTGDLVCSHPCRPLSQLQLLPGVPWHLSGFSLLGNLVRFSSVLGKSLTHWWHLTHPLLSTLKGELSMYVFYQFPCFLGGSLIISLLCLFVLYSALILFRVCKTASYHESQAGLEFIILLSQHLECGDYTMFNYSPW